jgi:peroxiredoxin
VSRLRLAFVLLLSGCATASSATTVASREALPPIELRTLDGQPARIGDVAGGRPALVSLWATWCEACAGELEALGRLDQATRGAGATVIAVAVGEPRERVAEFVRQHALGYTQLVDERFQLADALGQTRVPTTLVIDRDGRVVFRGGAFDAAALTALRRTLAPDARAAR